MGDLDALYEMDRMDEEDDRRAQSNAVRALERTLESAGISARRIPEAKQLVAQLKAQYDGAVSDEGCVRAIKSRLPEWFGGDATPGAPKLFKDMTAQEQQRERRRYSLR